MTLGEKNSYYNSKESMGNDAQNRRNGSNLTDSLNFEMLIS